jgi:hypothetical protein
MQTLLVLIPGTAGLHVGIDQAMNSAEGTEKSRSTGVGFGIHVL